MSSRQNVQPIPILFVIPTLGTGGSERVVLNLCIHLDRQLFSPIVAAFRDGFLKEEMVNAGVPVHVLNRRSGIDMRLTLKLIDLIGRYRVRVVNTHHFVSLFYAFWASRWKRVPLMHTEHSRWEMETLKPIWNYWFKFFLSRIEMGTAVSNEAFLHLLRVYSIDRERCARVPNGVDLKLFKPAQTARITRASLGLSTDDIVIGSVGNLRREKNQELLIKAMRIIKDQYKGRPIKAVLVGDGPRRSDLEKCANELGVGDMIILLGFRGDVPTLYSIFDIYSLTSRYEGLPLTVLEAMAAGLPVVGTAVLGIRELIRNNENGILVPDNDPSRLAEAIWNLIESSKLRNFLSENARRFVHDHYNLKNSINSYESIFNRLAERVSKIY